MNIYNKIEIMILLIEKGKFKEKDNNRKVFPARKRREILKMLKNNIKMTCLVYISIIFILLVDNFKIALADYENTWRTYYEQPCCGDNSNEQQYRLRHQKGEFEKKIFFFGKRKIHECCFFFLILMIS